MNYPWTLLRNKLYYLVIASINTWWNDSSPSNCNNLCKQLKIKASTSKLTSLLLMHSCVKEFEYLLFVQQTNEAERSIWYDNMFVVISWDVKSVMRYQNSSELMTRRYSGYFSKLESFCSRFLERIKYKTKLDAFAFLLNSQGNTGYKCLLNNWGELESLSQLRPSIFDDYNYACKSIMQALWVLRVFKLSCRSSCPSIERKGKQENYISKLH